MDWGKVEAIAFGAFAEAAQIAPELKGASLVQKASTIVDSANNLAAQVITEPAQQAEAAATYAAVKSVLNLLAAFHTGAAPASTAPAAS